MTDNDIKKKCAECANCIGGRCYDPDLIFIHGRTDEPPCQVVSDEYTIQDGGIVCDYFLLNVLPLSKELNRLVWAEIGKPAPFLDGTAPATEPTPSRKQCATCGKPFIPASNRQRYCGECAKEAERKANAKRAREYRARQ